MVDNQATTAPVLRIADQTPKPEAYDISSVADETNADISEFSHLRIAIVHDWLVSVGGAEQVLEQLLRCFPSADIFTLVDYMPEPERGFLKGHKITTSFLQHVPGGERFFRNCFSLMPKAIESLNLKGYDLVICSSWAFAKGVRLSPGQVQVSYVHTPVRYVWDMQDRYLRLGVTNPVHRVLARIALAQVRRWDIGTAQRGGTLVANSRFISRRIRQCWDRESLVLNPPVASGDLGVGESKDDFYLTVSRLVHYKAVEVLIEAFNRTPERRLIIIGDGPMRKCLQKLAGPNVTLLGYQPRAAVVNYLQRAKAFVFAAHEDFGIVLVEAQACGTPVIAYGKGGAVDSVIPYQESGGRVPATGLFFQRQDPESVIETIDYFEAHPGLIRAVDCVDNASRFSPEGFRFRLLQIIEREMSLGASSTMKGPSISIHQTPLPVCSHSTEDVAPR